MGEIPQIRGEPNREQEETLGFIKHVFNPCWLQAFRTGNILVAFEDEEPEFEDAFLSIMSNEGYELRYKDDDVWADYKFGK
jgi:hypothetical protein